MTIQGDVVIFDEVEGVSAFDALGVFGGAVTNALEATSALDFIVRV